MKLFSSIFLVCVVALVLFSYTNPDKDSFTERNLDVTSFNAVEISSGFITEIKQADSYSVKLEIPDKAISSLKAEVIDNKLILGFDTEIWDRTMHKHISFNRPKAVISTPSLDDIELHNASELKFVNGFTAKDIEIEVSGASHIAGTLKTEKLELYLSGASACKMDIKAVNANIEVSGASSLNSNIYADILNLETQGASSSKIKNLNAKTGSLFEANVSGASSLKAAGLPFKTIEIEASGASKAEIHATEKLDAEASGASVIRYFKVKGLIKNFKSGGASSIKTL